MGPLDYLQAQQDYRDARLRQYADTHGERPPEHVVEAYHDEARKAWALPPEMLHEHTERNTYRHNARWLHTGEPGTQRTEYPRHA